MLSAIVRVIVCVGLLAIALIVMTVLVRTKPVPARTDVSARAPRIIVMAAVPVEVRRQWDGYGTAQAMDSADVPARVTATVIEIPGEVLAGASVEAGSLLVRLDNSDFTRQEEIAQHAIADIDAQLRRIEIQQKSWTERVQLAAQQVELARAEFDRVFAAFERGVAKQREVDTAKQALIGNIRDETAAREELDGLIPRASGLQANRLGQESQRRLARQNVERCRITSPIPGVIQDVTVEVGESLASGQRVARVVDLRRIEVAVRLPSSARASIGTGDRAELRATGSNEQRWEVSVTRVAPEDDETTRTMGVFVEVEQDPSRRGAVVPGQFLRGIVTASVPDTRWVVPRRALAGERVRLVEDGRIASRPVEIAYHVEDEFPVLGVPDRQWVVLSSPLPEGALVVINASRSLPEGMHVEPVTAGDGSIADVGGSGELAP
ncbi:MAG: HlyD family efflux transporter periplasmic adaptor subunit [Planctomycetes bacterium]|nr:HlyD family efflux transporter periplasmic adaptor subunit [Planctomycetota bacterium]